MIRYYSGNRHVLILGPLTFKFPKLWLGRLFRSIRDRYPLAVLDWKIALGISFGENFTEAKWAFRKRPHQIVPCILPLGLVNVYPTVTGEGKVMVCEFFSHTYNQGFTKEFWRAIHNKGCDHTFKKNNSNFALHRGEVRILDYGAPGMTELLVNHQKELTEFLRAAKEYSVDYTD